MADEDLGRRVREFFHQLFGSRVASVLVESAARQRQDYESRLNERDELIAEYRETIAMMRAKLERYEMALIPLTSPAGSLLSPPRKPPTFESVTETPVSWAEVQRKLERELQEEYEAEQAAKESK